MPDAGWKTNPLVGIGAVVLLVLAVIVGFTCSRGGDTTVVTDPEELPPMPKTQGTVLLCTECGHQRVVPHGARRRDMVRIMTAPCSECGKHNTLQPGILCVNCGQYFLPPKPEEGRGSPTASKATEFERARGGASMRCPHCGKDPFAKEEARPTPSRPPQRPPR